MLQQQACHLATVAAKTLDHPLDGKRVSEETVFLPTLSLIARDLYPSSTPIDISPFDAVAVAAAVVADAANAVAVVDFSFSSFAVVVFSSAVGMESMTGLRLPVSSLSCKAQNR